MNEYSNMLNSLRDRNEDGIEVLAIVSGLSEQRLNEIADGANPTITEEMILDALK